MNNVEKKTGLLPKYNDPGIEIRSLISDSDINITLEIKDIHSFLNKVSLLSMEGKEMEYIKYGKKTIRLKISPKDSSERKAL